MADDDPRMEDLIEAWMTLVAFREAFQPVLNKTAMGLRSMVASERPELRVPGTRIPVVQRLKRRAQIVNKLLRFPESQLSNMGDVGGCRAVLLSRDEVDRVLRRVRRNWEIVGKVRDTRDEPAESGYRAVHAIVLREGRRVEIQLREPREHDWALAVERTGARLGIGLKEGEGPADLREYFRLASLGMYRDSVGLEPDPAFQAAFEASREQVRSYFRR
jgi:putative GTP pyrophosphokinase